MTTVEMEIGRLQRSLNAVIALVDTVPVKFGEDKLRIETVDASNVGAVTLVLEQSAFEHYEADGMELHIDIKQLYQGLQEFDAQEVARIVHDEEENMINVSVNSMYEFSLSPIHPDSVEGGIKAGHVDPPAEVKLNAGELKKSIRLADMFSDEIILGIDEERTVLYINAIGDTGNMAVSFDEDDDEIQFVENETAHGLYSRSYLNKMTKIIPESDDIFLSLGEEYPAKIEFEIADSDGKVEYGLAPRLT